MRRISDGEVHLWRLSLDVGGLEFARLNGWLASDEIARAARYHYGRDRLRLAAGRGRVREILSGYLGIGPAEVVFEYGPADKPALVPGLASRAGRLPGVRSLSGAVVAAGPATGLCFNLSHSESLGLLAVTLDRQVGVDLEFVKDMSDLERVAATVLSPREKALFDALTDDHRLETFYAYWTKKESLAKASGEGLGMPPEQLEVEPFTEEHVVLPMGRTGSFRVIQLRPADGYIGALAVEGEGWTEVWVDDDLRHYGDPGRGPARAVRG